MPTPIECAIADLGYTEEPPGSNITKFGAPFWPGRPSPWCMEAVSAWLIAGGVDELAPPGFASVGFFRNWCRDNGHLTDDPGPSSTRAVVVGFEWEHDTWPDHAGLVEAVTSSRINTIEGNSPSVSGVDEVWRHVRSLTQVSFFAAFDVAGGPEPAPPAPTDLFEPVHVPYPVLPTWMVLAAKPAGRPGFTNHGDKVGVYQSRMRDRGWRIGVDNVMGAQTEAVTLRFQAEKGLRNDGLVGQRTWAAAWTAPIT